MMTQITTDLRQTVESARRIRFEPTFPNTATDVQTAINNSINIPKTVIPTPVNFGMSPYLVQLTDTYLAVDTSGGSVTITLQASAARNNTPLTIKDITGNAAANPISLVPNGAETVDTLAPYPMDSNFLAISIIPKTGGGYFVDA